MTTIYQGKECLNIPDLILDIQNWSKSNIINIPIIKTLLEHSTFGYLTTAFNKIETNTISGTVYSFLQALYGVNRAFNSYEHDDLLGLANSINIKMTKNENSVYWRAIAADKFLDKSYISNKITELGIAIDTFEKPNFIEEWITESQSKILAELEKVNLEIESVTSAIQSYLSAIKNGLQLIGEQLLEFLGLKKEIKALKFQKKKLEKVIEKFDSSDKKSVRSAIVVVPAAVGTLTVITGMATFFLGLLGISAAGSLMGILSSFVNSIVLNFLKSSGALIARYTCAALLRANQAFLNLPAIFQITGMSGAAWSFLIQYSLPIIAASIIIITLIKSKSIIGNEIFVYGDGDTQLTILEDLDENNPLNHAEVNLTLTNKKLSSFSGKTYLEYYGFSVDYKGRVVYGINLNSDELLVNPQQLFNEKYNLIL